MSISKFPFEEQVEELTRQVRFLGARLERTQKGTPEHDILLRNLASVSVLKAEIEILLENAEDKTLTKT